MGNSGIKVWPGIVMEVFGTTPGPASGITYQVAVFADGGTVHIEMEPTGARFPDDLNTIAAPVGTAVTVHQDATEFRLLPPGEAFSVEACEDPEP